MFKFSLVAICAILALSACGGGDETSTVAPAVDPLAAFSPALSEVPMDTIVNTKLLTQLDSIFDNLVANGLETQIDGVSVFKNSGDKFLPGKVAIGMSYLLINTPKTNPKFQEYLIGYRKIMDSTIDLTNDTWGIYYYMSALNKLRKADLLDQAVSPATLVKLKEKLDWRIFVKPADYTLINLPTNYYGVAFSVARLRFMLGWEDASASEALLQKVINHYKTFSAFGFSDETDGKGRFDRYSILLIGEICQRLIETGMKPSDADMELLKGWLRQSVDQVKLLMNPAGNGINFGRSLGSYADTALAEVLSAAAHLDVLTKEEKDLAYAFATRITAKYVEFWYDSEMKSLNLWTKGRRTDGYRGKSRILGENLSMAHQLIYTNTLWKADGYATKPPMSSSDFAAALDKLPQSTLTKFAGFDENAATYDRGLITYRDGYRVISLPMVNGAKDYHRTNPYFAIPHSYNMISGVADAQWPQLIPKFTIDNDKSLIPASYIKSITSQKAGNKLQVNFTLDGMDNTAGVEPLKDERITSATQYSFEPGQITRIDTYKPTAATQSLNKIELEFGTYSKAVTQTGNKFKFDSGDVTGFELEGLDTCTVADVSGNVDYNTPTGALQNSIRCSTGPVTLDKPLTIKWVLTYKSPSIASIFPR